MIIDIYSIRFDWQIDPCILFVLPTLLPIDDRQLFHCKYQTINVFVRHRYGFILSIYYEEFTNVIEGFNSHSPIVNVRSLYNGFIER